MSEIQKLQNKKNVQIEMLICKTRTVIKQQLQL